MESPLCVRVNLTKIPNKKVIAYFQGEDRLEDRDFEPLLRRLKLLMAKACMQSFFREAFMLAGSEGLNVEMPRELRGLYSDYKANGCQGDFIQGIYLYLSLDEVTRGTLERYSLNISTKNTSSFEIRKKSHRKGHLGDRLHGRSTAHNHKS